MMIKSMINKSKKKSKEKMKAQTKALIVKKKTIKNNRLLQNPPRKREREELWPKTKGLSMLLLAI